MDEAALNRDLDRAKSDLFMTKYASFYGSLLCSLNFHWTYSIPTAATNGVDLFWNPDDFLKCTPGGRKTTLRHEVEHNARLHHDRRGDRDPHIWNIACDYRINNDLEDEGYECGGMGLLIDHDRFPPGMPEEDIYDILVAEAFTPPMNYVMDLSNTDINGQELTKEFKAQIVSNVVRASQQAKIAGAGNMPGDLETLLNTFLTPVVRWEQYLHRFFTELRDEDYSYARPNRRYSDMYLPSKYLEEGALAHLMYFEDVSGSILDADMIRFNSEIKFIKEVYEPELMTLVQFDTGIRHEQQYKPEDPFEHVIRRGYGGTMWKCVKDYIEEKRPTAVVIFSDMDFFDAIVRPSIDIPILWVGIHAKGKTMPFGQFIHIH